MNSDITPTTVEPWVNLEDVAKHLSVSKDTVRAWIRNNTIPYSRAGKQYKFKLSEVDQWVRNNKTAD